MTTTVPASSVQQLTISIYLVRDTHDNGMTLKQYADAVIADTHDILDHGEFVYQFGATTHNISTVTSWASVNGLSLVSVDAATATIKVQGTVGKFNTLFRITLLNETDETGRTYITLNGSPTIPAEISGVVEKVLGFDQSFVATKFATQVPLNAVPPNSDPTIYIAPVTPPSVATAYGLPPGDGFGGCIGIFELTYSGYVTGWNQTDVNNSFSRIGIATPPAITNYPIDGASVSTTTDAESLMDIYCAGAVAPNAKIVYYDAPNGGTMYINDIINKAATDTVNNPEVLSISWGIGDGSAFDSAMQSCVVRGITVIVSSGDHGATGAAIDWTSCTSPYCISAGGTNIGISGGVRLGESGWSGSGGGISNAQPLPSWQNGLTYQTKSNVGVLSSSINLPRRGVPDISAPADPYTGYQFYVNGSLQQWGGTSAAAPFLAGMIVRLNRLLGKRIGLPMATWYANTQAFYDITAGDNVDGYTVGYNCTSGWDAVTGLGTPNGQQFYKLFKTGSNFPAGTYGFRPTSGATYPRRRGIR